jgi:hypothetical protein
MRFSIAGAIAALLASGCVNASFTKTSDDYVVHEVDTLPEVFIDKLPEQAYDPVGIIEIHAPQAASLGEVMRAAAEKGQEVGCDVVVDRSIHRVDGARLRRWTVIVAVDVPASPTGEPRRPVSPYLGMIGGDPLRHTFGSTVIYNNYSSPSVPMDKREFVCGIFRPAGAAAAAARPSATAPRAQSTLAGAPTGAGGFEFHASAEDVRRACEQAAHTYAQATGGPDTCDGLPSGIGAPAHAALTYCEGKLCVVSLSTDLVGGASLGPALMRWRVALTERYGNPTTTRSDVPSSCSTDVTPCLMDGTGHISFEWRWPSGEGIALSHEVDAGGRPHVRLTYSVSGVKTSAPGL